MRCRTWPASPLHLLFALFSTIFPVSAQSSNIVSVSYLWSAARGSITYMSGSQRSNGRRISLCPSRQLPTLPNLHSLPTYPCCFPPSKPKSRPLKLMPVPPLPGHLSPEPPIAERVCACGPQAVFTSDAYNSTLTLRLITETRTITPHKCIDISGNHNILPHSIAR